MSTLKPGVQPQGRWRVVYAWVFRGPAYSTFVSGSMKSSFRPIIIIVRVVYTTREL